MQQKSDWALRLIIFFKLLEAVSLFLLGMGLLHILGAPEFATVHGVIDQLRPDSHNHLINIALEKILAIPRSTLKLLSVGTFAYAVLFGVEGVGLIYRKTWAEWMVVISTAGFIPVELYEVFERFEPLRVITLIINIAILIYLIKRLKAEARERHAHHVAE